MGGAIRRPEDRDHQDHREREQRAHPRPRVQHLDLVELRLQSARVPIQPSTEPATAPLMIQRVASPTTCPATSRGEAPSATRTALSRLRCATRYEATLYRPAAASSSASAANAVSNEAVKRGCAVSVVSISSLISIVTICLGSRSAAICRRRAAASTGGAAVRNESMPTAPPGAG